MVFRNGVSRLATRLVQIIFIIILLFNSVGCSVQYEDKLVGKSLDYSSLIMSLLSRNIQLEMSKVEASATEIAFSDLVQNGIKGYKNLNVMEKLDFSNKLNKTLTAKFILHSHIRTVELISSAGDIIGSLGSNKRDKQYIDDVIKNANSRKGQPLWNLNQNKNIVFSRGVVDIGSGQLAAVISIELENEFFTRIFKDINLGAGSDIYIVDRKGIVISSTSPNIELGKEHKNITLLSKILNDELGNDRGFSVSINQEKYLVTFAELTGHNWYIICTIPYNSIVN